MSCVFLDGQEISARGGGVRISLSLPEQYVPFYENRDIGRLSLQVNGNVHGIVRVRLVMKACPVVNNMNHLLIINSTNHLPGSS